MALLSLIDDPELREFIGIHLAMGEARAAAKRATLPHIAMVGVLRRKFQASPTPYIGLATVTECYNEEIAMRGERPLTPKAVGCLVRNRLGIETTKSRGVYVIEQSQRGKIEDFARRYGLTAE